LEIPQLATHLSERGYDCTLPLRQIFNDCKVKKTIHKQNLIRTFWVLCKLYPERNLDLLGNSLEIEFGEEMNDDKVITVLKRFGVKVIVDSFNSYQIKLLYESIQHKMGLVFDSCAGFDSSSQLRARANLEQI